MMPDDVTPESGETQSQPSPASEPKPGAERRITEQRDRYKSRAEAAEAKVREFEAREAESAEAKEREAQDFKALEERYTKKLAERDKTIADYEERETQRIRKDRRASLVHAISKKSGVTNTRLLEGLLSVAKQDGVDDAPEELTDGSVAEALAAMTRISPETFSGSGGGGSPGQPGSTTSPSDILHPEIAKAKRAAEKASQRNVGMQSWKEMMEAHGK